MRIGIIGAMDIEVQVLKNLMDSAKIEKISGIEFYSGKINGADTVVAVAGVGKVNAAVCAEAMILKYSPDCLINVGVAGGLSPELKIGVSAYINAAGKAQRRLPPPIDSFKVIVAKRFVNVASKVRTVMRKLWSGKKVKFLSLFEGAQSKSDLVATFLQFLSLQKQKRFQSTEICKIPLFR